MLATVLLGLPGAASAAPMTIGSFVWGYDTVYGSGSTFTVSNESISDFSSVFIDLYQADAFYASGADSDLGDVASGTTTQSIEDFSSIVVPDDVSRAQLRFQFNNQTRFFTLFANSLVGDPANYQQASMELVVDDDSGPPAPVPEPSTLLLLGGGLGAVLLNRLRTPRGGVSTSSIQVRRE